jgi:hypothetical protein
MRYLIATLCSIAFLLLVEKLFQLGIRGRRVLAVTVLIWAFYDAIQSVRNSPEHPLVIFCVSFMDSAVVLVLWWYASTWIREAGAERRRQGHKAPDASRGGDLL